MEPLALMAQEARTYVHCTQVSTLQQKLKQMAQEAQLPSVADTQPSWPVWDGNFPVGQ